jgi:hypothetical protein
VIKNLLFLLILVLAFAGCKNVELVELDKEEWEEEVWKKLPDSIIPIRDKEILALHRRGGVVHIHTKNWYYAVDSNLNLIDSGLLHISDNWYPLWAPKYGKNYIVLVLNHNTYKVADNSQVTNDKVSYFERSFLDSGYSLIHASEVTDENQFSTIAFNYDSFAVLQNWQIEHTPGSQDIIKVKELSRIRIDSTSNTGDRKVYRFGNRIIVNIGAMAWIYEGDKLLEKYRFVFQNLIELDGILYGGGSNAAFMPDPKNLRRDGLMKSTDGGLTWEFTVLDIEVRRLGFFEIDGQIYSIGGRDNLNTIGLSFKHLTPMEVSGLDSYPYNIEKVGNYVLIGTDAGLYYKSWESFIGE